MDRVSVIAAPSAIWAARTWTRTRSCRSSFSSGSSVRASASSSSTTGPQEPGWELPANPILVAGENFGCGSSREHAPWGLQDYGFRAIVAPSFADIFYMNCTKIGLLPVVLAAEDAHSLARAGEGEIDLEEQEVRFAGRQVAFEIDHEIRRRLLAGLDDIGVTLASEQAIGDYERERAARAPGDPGHHSALSRPPAHSADHGGSGHPRRKG